ncbi:hypothetical protein ACFV6F_39540, partial [Kitasatospora phosalacinea]|uniref:hypothetical protein n=1 Tax=Kitasatospora phosalacinea TaxID=2065 RepID=UPI003668A5EF
VLLCHARDDSAAPPATEAAAAAVADAVAGGAALGAAAVTAAAASIAAALTGASPHGGGTGPAAIGTPVLTEVAYRDGRITAHWEGAARAAGYVLQVLRPDGTELAARTLGLVLGTELPLDSEPLPAGDYPVRLKGVRGDTEGVWSAPVTLVKTAAPAPTLAYGDGSLAVSCPPPPGAERLVLQVFDPHGTRLLDTVVPAGQRPGPVPLLPQAWSGAYRVAARALRAGHFPGAWSPQAPFKVINQPPPEITSFQQADGAFTAAWRTAQPCDASVVDGTTGAVVASVRRAGAGAAVLRPRTAIEPGRSYTLRVQIDRPGFGMSDTALRVLTARSVGAPAPAALHNDDGTVTASWAAVGVAGAAAPTGYDYRLIDAAAPDRPVVAVDGLVVTSTRVLLPGDRPLQQRHTYRLQVRARSTGNPGSWTTSPDLLMVRLPAPLRPLLALDTGDGGGAVALSWTDPAEVTADTARTRLTLTASDGPLPADAVPGLGYQVVLSCAGAEVARAEGVTATGARLVRTDGARIRLGESYTARVRLAGPDTTGPWAETPRADVLGPVQGARAWSLSPNWNPLLVSWTPPSVPPAGVSFDVRVTRESDILGRPLPEAARTSTLHGVDPATPAGPSPASARIATTGWSGGYRVRVRARTSQAVGPWTDAGGFSVVDTRV